MEALLEVVRTAGTWTGYGAVVLLCLAGVMLSCLSLFGAWVVAGAALLAAWLSGPEYPGLITVVVFCVVAGILEVIEALAGAWGVQGRGGSALAGFAALAGGLLGLVFGSALVPIPILGSLAGMMLGGFGLAFLVERFRLNHAGRAAHIAWGAVTARVLVIFIKVVVTLGMGAWLVTGMLVGAAKGQG